MHPLEYSDEFRVVIQRMKAGGYLLVVHSKPYPQPQEIFVALGEDHMPLSYNIFALLVGINCIRHIGETIHDGSPADKFILAPDYKIPGE
jgi:hypothetical protein